MTIKSLKVLWPIENNELKKFLPMAIIFGCILFNYNMLRTLKDGLVVPNIGAEAISFIKVYLVVPSAIIFAMVYAKMTNLMTQKQIFLSFCSFFLAFFMIFAFILYPNQHLFHPDADALDQLSTKTVSILGIYNLHLAHFKWFLKIFAKWSYALCYVFSEIWGSMMLSLLFWQFANSITKTNEAKRFYPMIGFFGNIGLILGGQMAIRIPKDNEVVMVSLIIWAVSASIVILMGVYTYMTNIVLTDPRYVPTTVAKKRKKLKMSFTDGMKVIFSSKYLGLITILVLCYGITVNLVEGPWKDAVRRVYPTTSEYIGFMGLLQTFTGIFTMIAFFVSAQILKKVSWFAGAILTPLVLFISGTAFFVFLVLDKSLAGLGGIFTMFDPIYLAAIFGLAQNVASKSTKYSFFDPTKEMAYIPIDVELQTKGKAAVDIIGARLAKACGALLQSTIFILFPSVGFIGVAPYFMVVFVVLCMLWLLGVKLLNTQYKKFLQS